MKSLTAPSQQNKGDIMSHKNKLSLIGQVNEVLSEKLQVGVGTSKHGDKETRKSSGEDPTRGKIYSYETYRGYLKWSCYFVKYCKEEHKSKTLEDCRQYVNEYIQKGIDDGKSASTLKLIASSLAKLYDCSTTEFIQTPPRKRSEIIRSRGAAVRDKHFSEKNNYNLIIFCQNTGLRRKELSRVCGTALKHKDGKYYIKVLNGKGGKVREAPIIGEVETIINMMKAAGSGRVFENIPGAADIHGYRRQYALTYYEQIARPLDTLTKKQKYYCRGDKLGYVYDKAAMYEVSRALGHNRRNVVASHYLY